MLPRIGRRKIWRNTATETQVGKYDFAVIAPNGPRLKTVPFSPTALCVISVRYGPKSAPTMVVEKAELAQSYIFQPNTSRGLFFSRRSGFLRQCFNYGRCYVREAFDSSSDMLFIGAPDNGWNLIQSVITRREIFDVAVIAGEYN